MELKASATFFNANVDDADRRPFSCPQDGKTETVGEAVPVRDPGSSGNLLAVGSWRYTKPGKSPVYSSELGDETFLVLEGEVHITALDAGEVFESGPGDIAFWSPGTRTSRDVKSPFKQFCVVAQT